MNNLHSHMLYFTGVQTLVHEITFDIRGSEKSGFLGSVHDMFPAFHSIAGNTGSMGCIVNNNINVGVSWCGVRVCWGYMVAND